MPPKRPDPRVEAASRSGPKSKLCNPIGPWPAQTQAQHTHLPKSDNEPEFRPIPMPQCGERFHRFEARDCPEGRSRSRSNDDVTAAEQARAAELQFDLMVLGPTKCPWPRIKSTPLLSKLRTWMSTSPFTIVRLRSVTLAILTVYPEVVMPNSSARAKYDATFAL